MGFNFYSLRDQLFYRPLRTPVNAVLVVENNRNPKVSFTAGYPKLPNQPTRT